MLRRSLRLAALFCLLAAALTTAGACRSLPVPPVYEAGPGAPLGTGRGFFVLYGDARPGSPTTVEVQMLTAPGRWEVVDRVALTR